MFADLNRGRVLLFSSIISNCSFENPVEQITRGFFVFSVKSKSPFRASALEKSKRTSYSILTSAGVSNIGNPNSALNLSIPATISIF